MYLARLYIRNYRSIKELDLKLSKGKNVIIGKNNTGKSNIIKALDLILGEHNPAYAKGNNIDDSDFYSWQDSTSGETIVRSANEIFIWCELDREPGETLNYDEIYSCFGFKVPRNNRIPIPADDRAEEYRNVFQTRADDLGRGEWRWIDPKLRNQLSFEHEFEDKHSFAFAFLASKDAEGKITKDIRFLYREDENHNWVLAFTAPIRNELLQSAIIPSFRDPQNQLRLTPWTWYGKLMRRLTEQQAQSQELQTAFNQVKAVADRIFEEIKHEMNQSALNVAFPGTEVHFQFNADTRTDLYKSCLIYLDDGFKSLLTDKGSGIQSATIIGLFNYYTKHVNTVASALLCIEEPELYLHPHARRVLSDRLDAFLDGNKNQVVLTTHSVEFIRTVLDDLNVILVKKGTDGTRSIPVRLREFKNLLIDNNQNELFFADKVIVCEGFESFILREVSQEFFPGQLDTQNISIITAGGKDRISQIVELVLKLGIKCFVFSDFDYLLRDQTGRGRTYGQDVKDHQSLADLSQNFYTQQCLFGNRGARILRSIKQWRSRLRKKDEQKFYTAKTTSEFSDHERLLVLLKTLSKNGIGILSTEFENLCHDRNLVSPKMNLNSLYSIGDRINSGTKISDLFDTTALQDFLRAVIER